MRITNKILTLTLSLFAASATFANSEDYNIENWDQLIPITQKNLIESVREKAYQDLYVEEEGVTCGSETWDHELTDYYTDATYTGDLSHHLTLEFKVNTSHNYCLSVITLVCKAPIAINNRSELELKKWDCYPVNIND